MVKVKLGLPANLWPRFLNRWWPILLLVIINLVITGGLALSHSRVTNDRLLYYETAKNLASGEGFTRDIKYDVHSTDEIPPYAVDYRLLYPFLTSLVFRVVGISINHANLTAAIFKALLVIPIFLLGDELFSRPAGLVAALLYTLNPAYTELGIIAMPATTAAFLYYTCLLLLFRYFQRGGCWWALTAGLFAGLSYLAREEAALLLLFGSAVIIIRGFRKRNLALFWLMPALAFSLHGLNAYSQEGTITLLSYGTTPLSRLWKWAAFYELQPYSWSEYIEAVGGISGAVQIRVYNCLAALKSLFADGIMLDTSADSAVGLLPPWFILPIILSYTSRREPAKRRFLRLLSALVLIQFLVTTGYPGYLKASTGVRHVQIVAPFLILLAGGGLAALLRSNTWSIVHSHTWMHTLLLSGTILILAGYLFFALMWHTITVDNYLWAPPVRDPTRRGAEWCRDHIPSDAILMSGLPARASYFSQRPAVALPGSSFAEVMRYAHRHHVTHLILTDRERSGVPSLPEGITTFAESFHHLYTAEGVQVIAISDYTLLDAALRTPLPGDRWTVRRSGQQVHVNWRELLTFRRRDNLGNFRAVCRQWLDRLKAGDFRLTQTLPPPTLQPLDATLGDSVKLLGYRTEPMTVRPGEVSEVVLQWQCLAPLTADLIVFTHVLDEIGFLRSQHDAQPVDGERPTWTWEAGEVIEDCHKITIPPGVAPGDYRIEIGMYDLQTLQRLLAFDAEGHRLPEDRILLPTPIEVVTQ